MKPGATLTASRLREVIHYNPETGVLSWACDEHGKAQGKGRPAGTLNRGYIFVQIDKKRFRAHRLAWLYMTGEWPELDVDHRNGIGRDNRWTNLREITHATNIENQRRPHIDSRTGLLGVGSHRSGKYRAQITVRGKQRHLGYFTTPDEAHAAYLIAKRELHPGSTL